MKKTTLFALAGLNALSSFATPLFKVNFNEDDVGLPPTTGSYLTGITSNEPTRIVMDKDETMNVVKEAGDLKDQPLILCSNKNSTGKPCLIFDGGNNLVRNGKVEISWDSAIAEYISPSKGVETVLGITIIGNSGTPIMVVNYVALNSKSGIIGTALVKGKSKKVKWQLGKKNHFVLILDITAGTYSLKIDDIEAAKNARIATKTGLPFRLVQFTDGRNIGGRDGKSKIAVDNVLIRTLEVAKEK